MDDNTIQSAVAVIVTVVLCYLLAKGKATGPTKPPEQEPKDREQAQP